MTSFVEGFIGGLQGGMAFGAQAELEKQRAKREDARLLGKMFAVAVQNPEQGQHLLRGVFTALDVPPEQQEQYFETLKNFSEAQRAALAAYARTGDPQAQAHIAQILDEATLERLKTVRQTQVEEQLRSFLVGEPLLGPPQAEGPARSPGVLEQLKSDPKIGPAAEIVGQALASGALDAKTGMQYLVELVKARGTDPETFLQAISKVSAGGGAPTIKVDSKGGLSATFEPQRPLSPSELNNLAVPQYDAQGNIVGWTKLPPGTTMEEARRMGAVVVSGNLAKTGPISAILDNIEQLSRQLFTRDKGGTSFWDRLRNTWQATTDYWTQKNPVLNEYQAIVGGVATQIMRALDETGTLTDQDIKRALDLLPQAYPIPDTPEVAQQKIARLRRIVQEIEKGNINAARRLAGIPPASSGSAKQAPASSGSTAQPLKRYRYNPVTKKFESVS